MLWGNDEQAKAAAVKAYSKWTHADADEQLDQVAKLIKFAEPDATDDTIRLHFFNLVETLRNGGTYEQWLEQSAIN